MKERSYMTIAGAIFFIVALAHLLRLITGWPIAIGDWEVPLWISVGGMVVPGGMAIWAARLVRHAGQSR